MGMRAKGLIGDTEDLDVLRGCLVGLLIVVTGLAVMFIGLHLLWRFTGWLVTLPR